MLGLCTGIKKISCHNLTLIADCPAMSFVFFGLGDQLLLSRPSKSQKYYEILWMTCCSSSWFDWVQLGCKLGSYVRRSNSGQADPIGCGWSPQPPVGIQLGANVHNRLGVLTHICGVSQEYGPSFKSRVHSLQYWLESRLEAPKTLSLGQKLTVTYPGRHQWSGLFESVVGLTRSQQSELEATVGPTGVGSSATREKSRRATTGSTWNAAAK